MSTMWSTCSMSTGHSCMQAPQVVQSQTTSSSITPGLSGCGSVGCPFFRASMMAGPLAKMWSRSESTSSFGDSGLPVFHAGHTCWHRPHSVQAYRSRFSFHVRSWSEPAPRTGISSDSPIDSRSILIARSFPRAFVFEKNTLGSLEKMCRCFEYGMYARNPRISRMCDQRNRCSKASFEPCPMCRNNGVKTLENGVQDAGDSLMPRAIREAFRNRSVNMIPKIMARMKSASCRWLPMNRSGR